MGSEHQLHRVDAVCFGDLLAANISARNEEHDELCGGDYRQRRSPVHVRSGPISLPH